MITVENVERVLLDDTNLNLCVDNAQKMLSKIVDRNDLHERDNLERFNNILMGEIAEQMVIQWFVSQGKFVESAVDKDSNTPDSGHDIWLKQPDGKKVKCSIKSSLSYSKGVDGILSTFKLATTFNELRDINIQVYFWLNLYPAENSSRKTFISFANSAIIGWFGINDLKNFESYNYEKRLAPTVVLNQARSMQSLLPYLI